MRSRRSLGIGLSTLAIASALLGGCGNSPEPPPPGSPSASENLVTRHDIAATDPDSPGRALMTWWRSIQYAALPSYLESLSRPLRRELEGSGAAKGYLPLAASQLVRAKPKVSETEVDGNRATLYARVEIRVPLGSTRFQSSSSPQAFTAVREDGEWKIANDLYIQSQAQLVAESRKAAAAAQE
jgi:hypothetical protein